MSEIPEGLVPARYVGGHVVDLHQTGKTWYNTDGSRKDNLRLTGGDTVMMPAEEILGKTVLNAKNGNQTLLGVGRVILPEHKDVPVEELGLLGYQFDAGRTDFEPVEPSKSKAKHAKEEEDKADVVEEKSPKSKRADTGKEEKK